MTDAADITLIMPLKHHRADFLRQALASVTKQDYPRWRLLVVVEEGDRPRFETMLAQTLADDRAALLTMTGAAFTGSINSGMRHASTEYVALLFADDLLAPNAIRLLSDAIRSHPEVDFLYSGWQALDTEGHRLGAVRLPRATFALTDFKWGSPIKHLMWWRRSLGLAVGGIDETLVKAPDDYDFPWTMAERGALFRPIPACLYFIREHCEYERRTTHIPRSTARRGILAILKKHRIGLAERYWIVARRYRGSLGRQTVYRNPLDRRLTDRLGLDPRRRWRRP